MKHLASLAKEIGSQIEKIIANPDSFLSFYRKKYSKDTVLKSERKNQIETSLHQDLKQLEESGNEHTKELKYMIEKRLATRKQQDSGRFLYN